MTPMKMWSPLLSLLTPSPSNTPSIQTATLWIIGTAVQNNPKAQSDLLSQQSPEVLPLILSVLKNEDAGVRSKAMYALSALLKLHGKALVKFEGVGGWDVLKEALRGECVLGFLVSEQKKDSDSLSLGNEEKRKGIPGWWRASGKPSC